MTAGFASQVSLLGLLLFAPNAAQPQTPQSIVNGTMNCVSVANCDAPDHCVRSIIYPQFKIQGDGAGYALLTSEEPRPIRQFNDVSASNDFLSIETAEQAFWLVVVPASIVAREDNAVQRDFHLHSVSQNLGTGLKSVSNEFMMVSCTVVDEAGSN